MCKNIYLTDMLDLDSDNGNQGRNAGAEDTWVNTTGESDDKGRSWEECNKMPTSWHFTSPNLAAVSNHQTFQWLGITVAVTAENY